MMPLGLSLVCAMSAATTHDDLLQATLTVDNGAVPKPILNPGELFGSFFEDFLHAGEGGVYAEMLSNKALALPLANTSSFRCSGAIGTGECTWYVEGGTVTRDRSVPLNSAVPNTMWLEPSAIATNAGFPGGIAVNAGDSLTLSFFVNVQGAGRASIEARLVDGMEPTSRVLGRAITTAQDSEWVRVVVSLDVKMSSGSDGCRFQLINSANSTSRVGVTVVSLFPLRTWLGRKNGLRTDVAEWLNESQPAFLRTPGGCYIEGRNLSASGWDWKQTLGPIESRPGHMNDVWGYWTDDGLGMLELLQMADDVGARPLLVVNAGCSVGDKTCVSGTALEPYVQGALDAVEYVIGDASTVWGGKRAAAGRPVPFDLKALGIGNENCGTGESGKQYARNWYVIATAVRAKYPHIPLVLGCEEQDQMLAMLRVEPRIRTLADMYDVHQRKSPEQFLAAAHEFDSYPRTHYPKLFVSEYSSPRWIFPNWTNVGAAVAEAIYMAGMEANGDVVSIATYGDLMANSRDDHGSAGTSTILIDAGGSFGSPSWVVQKLFMSSQPAALVRSKLEMTAVSSKGVHSIRQVPCTTWPNGGTCVLNGTSNSPSSMLAASVSLSTTGEIQAKLVNYGARTVTLVLELGMSAPAGAWTWMASPTPDTVNSFADPRRVRLQDKVLTFDAGKTTIQLPPWSASAVKVRRGD